MLLHGIPRYERRRGVVRQLGWTLPPITPQELQRWAAFERVMGPMVLGERLDVATGFISLVTASVNSDGKHPLKLADFMPHWDEKDQPQQDPEQMKAVIDALARKGPDAYPVHPEPTDAAGVAGRPRGPRHDESHR